jgi:hypothetical protein
MTGAVMFGDPIISSTELKNNLGKWFEQASKTPVSITNTNGRSFVLLSRENARKAFLSSHYCSLILRFVAESEKKNGTEACLSVFPWANKLSDQDRAEFIHELLTSFVPAAKTDTWTDIEELINSWEATSEALSNELFMEEVNSEPNSRSYTQVE